MPTRSLDGTGGERLRPCAATRNGPYRRGVRNLMIPLPLAVTRSGVAIPSLWATAGPPRAWRRFPSVSRTNTPDAHRISRFAAPSDKYEVAREWEQVRATIEAVETPVNMGALVDRAERLYGQRLAWSFFERGSSSPSPRWRSPRGRLRTHSGHRGSPADPASQ